MTLRTCSASNHPSSVWSSPLLLSTTRKSQDADTEVSQVSLGKDTFGHCMSCLATEDIAKSCLVSKSWESFIDGTRGRFLWKNASIREGVPLVEGETRNYKENLAFLRPITISGRTIANYLGTVVGPIPNMSADQFSQLKNSTDPFRNQKLMQNTHIVLVNPAALEITTGPDQPVRLDASGTLMEIPQAEREGMTPTQLIVPLSLRNLIILTGYSPADWQNGPVWSTVRSNHRILDECGPPPPQNQLYLMRKASVLPRRTFADQKAVVEQYGYEIMGVRLRMLYDTIRILKTGKCSDILDATKHRSPGRYVRTPELLAPHSGVDHRVTIGDFAYNDGIIMTTKPSLSYADVSVVPGVRAEAPKPLEREL